jgi:hypothetical protein
LTYSIHHHCHNFSAWAASRAASVVGCRFRVEQGRALFESIGLGPALDDPEKLPEPHLVDTVHRNWRQKIIKQAQKRGIVMTHGVAAKLINVYLKSRFVCGGHSDNQRVRALHPPIDGLLLKELSIANFGGLADLWALAQKARWSKFDSETYEKVIDGIRSSLKGAPLWEIEQFWQGFQG